MKKVLLLSICFLGVCGISACSSFPGQDETEVFISEEDLSVVDNNTESGKRCGANGISCNDTALVNYSKTEADYRAYGERTKRDHLYTQASAGNNLSATIRPGIEDDIVTADVVVSDTIRKKSDRKYVVDDGVFSQTDTLNIETNPETYQYSPAEKAIPPVPQAKRSAGKTTKSVPLYEGTTKDRIKKEAVRKENNLPKKVKTVDTAEMEEIEKEISAPVASDVADIVIAPNTDKANPASGKTTTAYTIVESKPGKIIIRKHTDAPKNEIGRADNIERKEVRKTIMANGETFEIVCDEECEDIIAAAEDEDSITSEFTEESFDIADYIDDENIKFTDIGEGNNNEVLLTDIDINELNITDSTVLTWEAAEGENLRELLTKWSAMAGWKLLWNTNRNYVLNAGVMFKGKFADVSSALVRAFARARPAPIATYYKGNRVIVIETMENENAY